MLKLRDFFGDNRKNSPETCPIVHVDEAGKQTANKVLFDILGEDYSIDWSLPQSVGLKGDNRFVGDSLVIVPKTKDALGIMYGGFSYSRRGSHTPLGELSNRFTNEIEGVGRVLVEIARRED